MLLSKFGIDGSFLAHTPDETLIEHSNLTLNYFDKIIESKTLNPIIDNLILIIDKNYTVLIKDMFRDAIYLHDIGKKNPYFQAIKMDNHKFEEYKNSSSSTNHSSNSADEYIEHYLKIIAIQTKDKTIKRKLWFILYSFAYQISKHHGTLSLFKDYKSKDTEMSSSFKHIKRLDIKPFEFYILNKLLFSLLISSDYYATTQYMAHLKTKQFGLIDDAKTLIKQFENHHIIKDIRADKNQNGINKLRSQMFLEAEQNLLKNMDKNIFYLEAPTGSGKTLTSVNLAMNIIKEDAKINKIFYIFPFNTLVEQTKNVLDDLFQDTLDVEVINAITPLNLKDDNNQEDEESKYQKSYINRLFFHNELIITTHISLFNILFGTSKEDIFPLWQLANSVIILDEIQSYDNNLWTYMTKFFSIYAKSLNIKMIIMSATLPKLDKLIENKDDIFATLIKNRDDYFKNELFKNRVKIDYSLLDEKINYELLKETLYSEKENYNKILFEFIKKQSAREFFELLKSDEQLQNFTIVELSGDDNKAFRQKIIDKSKEKNRKIIIIATQVIEAGVDIDMDLGFKNISTLDGEEQFMGRINRSCKNSHLDPKVYFFYVDEAENIYKNDNRIEFNLKTQKYKDILKSKNFIDFYDDVLNKIKFNDKKINSGILPSYEAFTKDVQELNYKNISAKMKLIKNQNFRLFFPFKLNLTKYNLKEFDDVEEEFLTHNHLDGKKVWDSFKELNDIKEFSKREYSKSKINFYMQFFTYNIIKYSSKQNPPYFDYEYGGYYYISNYHEFIKDEKFDRVTYQNKSKDIFW